MGPAFIACSHNKCPGLPLGVLGYPRLGVGVGLGLVLGLISTEGVRDNYCYGEPSKWRLSSIGWCICQCTCKGEREGGRERERGGGREY